MCSSPSLFHASALVDFFRALRVSELVALTKHDFSGHALSVRVVRLEGGNVAVML